MKKQLLTKKKTLAILILALTVIVAGCIGMNSDEEPENEETETTPSENETEDTSDEPESDNETTMPEDEEIQEEYMSETGEEVEEDESDTENESETEEIVVEELYEDTDAKTVSISENEFDPNTITIESGQDIIFGNEGHEDHTITIEELNYNVLIESGEAVVLEGLEEEGEYSFECTLHEGMEGTITVQ